jgi:hypothetical protein
MTPVTIPILGRTRWNRTCLICEKPITLGTRADTKVVCAFEPDPRSYGIALTREGIIEQWSVDDRHKCTRKAS